MTATVEIPLTRGLVALIDAADYDLVKEHRWHANPVATARGFYARTTIPSRVKGVHNRGLSMHILIFGEPHVDHINGDGIDNRRANLRKATAAQNGRNRTPSANNTSGFKGVFWFPQGSKNWRAMIRHNNRLLHLGLFQTREEAAAA